MKETLSGPNKVKQISDVLKTQTLEPAKKEAVEIVVKAKKQADEIIAEARKAAQEIIQAAKVENQREQQVFESTLRQAYHQIIEKLKQSVVHHFFTHNLKHLIVKNMEDPKGIASLVSVLVKAVEKEGTNADISAYISAAISTKAVNEALVNDIISSLKEKSVMVSSINGGVQIKLHDQNLILDVSDAVLEEILSHYIRDDFREMIFAKK